MISRQSALVFINNILSAFVGYIAMFAVVRFMGKEALGIAAFAISFVALFSFITNLGFDSAHIKRISEGKDVGRCNGTYISIKLVLLGLFIFIVFLSLYIWTGLMGNGFETKTHENAIYPAILYWSLFGLLSVFISTFNGRREIARSQSLIFINNFTRSSLMIIVAVFSLGVIALVNAYVAGALVAILIGLYMFRKMPVSMPDKKYAKSYLKFAIPISIASSAIIIASNTDVVMIQWFWSSLDVADYYAAKKIAMLLTMIGISISTVLFPAMSKMHSKGDLEGVKDITLRTERYLSMFVFPVMFFIIIFPDKILNLLSRQMESAIPTLQILVIFYTLVVINSPYSSQLPALNRTDISGKIGVIRAFMNIGLNLIFIPKSLMGIPLLGMGAMGAALATLITFLVTTVNLRFAAYKLTGAILDKRIMLHISSAILTSILFLLIDTSWVRSWYTVAFISVLFMVVYMGILYLIKELKKEDIEVFIEAFHPGKMIKYIGGEIRQK